MNSSIPGMFRRSSGRKSIGRCVRTLGRLLGKLLESHPSTRRLIIFHLWITHPHVTVWRIFGWKNQFVEDRPLSILIRIDVLFFIFSYFYFVLFSFRFDLLRESNEIQWRIEGRPRCSLLHKWCRWDWNISWLTCIHLQSFLLKFMFSQDH